MANPLTNPILDKEATSHRQMTLFRPCQVREDWGPATEAEDWEPATEEED